MTTSPLILHAAPGSGFDQPFEMLVECHQRVQRMLVLLERLAAHLATHGSDAQASDAARDVMRYFDVAGPAHHEDEERHLFPALRAAGGPAAAALVTRLHREHESMTRQWQTVRADLNSVRAGATVGEAHAQRWAGFAALYREHIALEEAQAYPQAAPLFDTAALAAIGDEMARRRGAR